MKVVKSYVLLTILMLVSVEFVIAQSSVREKLIQQQRMEAIAQLMPRNLVRVHTRDQVEIMGRFIRSDNDSLFLGNDAGGSSVSIAAIDALWVRGRATGRGAKTGAIILGVAGLAAGILGAVVCGSFDAGDNCGLAVPAGAGAGLLAGGFLGAVVGSGFRSWLSRFRSPDYDPDVSLSEEELATRRDAEAEYFAENLKTIHPNRLRFSVVPDFGRGGLNVSASLTF